MLKSEKIQRMCFTLCQLKRTCLDVWKNDTLDFCDKSLMFFSFYPLLYRNDRNGSERLAAIVENAFVLTKVI